MISSFLGYDAQFLRHKKASLLWSNRVIAAIKYQLERWVKTPMSQIQKHVPHQYFTKYLQVIIRVEILDMSPQAVHGLTKCYGYVCKRRWVSVWPEGYFICSTFAHSQQYEFANKQFFPKLG